MSDTKVTTHGCVAQQGCAYELPYSFAGAGVIAEQPHFRPITRRALMAAVNTIGRELGLRSSSVVVLDALLSCLPCNDRNAGKDAPITPLTLLTVFASNDTLCFRAKGLSDRQLRRHLDKLEELNLIRRRDSANGKRFPVMQKGKVIGAFGIDLSPLLSRSEEVLELAQKHRENADELRGLKSIIQRLRLECLDLVLEPEAQNFVEFARNLLRRTGTTVVQAMAIIDKLKAILTASQATPDLTRINPLPVANFAEVNAEEVPADLTDSNKMSGTDGQNVRHKETKKSYTKKMDAPPIPMLWESLTTIPAFYPEAPCSEHGLLQLLFEFGKMLRIEVGNLAKALSTLGLAKTLMVTDQIAGKGELVQSPDRYLSKIIASCAIARVGHGQLSFAP